MVAGKPEFLFGRGRSTESEHLEPTSEQIRGQHAKDRRAIALLAVPAVVLVATASAIAMGPPVVNQTDHFVNEVSTDVGVHP